VSPHNVMLSYDGDVKLLDFGVAKLESAAHLTKTGEVKGKTAYMSPEQAMGETLDRRSDLYSVGAVLFEIITGRRMWVGDTDLELLRQLALAEPPKLADAATKVPREIQDLHARLVAKKPKDRPKTAREVAQTLRAFAPQVEAQRTALAQLLDQHYAEQARDKRNQLEAALVRHSEPPDSDAMSGEPGAVIGPATSPRSSRLAPWAYALVGAAVASAAVLGLARNRAAPAVTTASSAPTQTPTPTTPQSVSSAAASSVAKPVVTQPFIGPRGRPPTAHSSTPAASILVPTQHPPIDVDPHAI
jgi:serine/threonine-protein kinase